MASRGAPDEDRFALAGFLRPTIRVNLGDGLGARMLSTFSTVFGLAPAAPSDGRLQHDFFLEKQSQTNWCWAAVGVAVNRFFDRVAVTQCALVQKTRQPTGVNCCQTPGAVMCNTTEKVSRVLSALAIPRLTDPPQPQAPIDIAEIQHDISRNRPIICAMSGGGSNHFVVIVAWAIVDGTPFVFVDDPAVGGRKERALDLFRTSFDGRQWIQTTRLQ